MVMHSFFIILCFEFSDLRVSESYITGAVDAVNYDNFGQIIGHNNLASKLVYKWSKIGELIESL